jgi:CzcA family heavy metal efflux pump
MVNQLIQWSLENRFAVNLIAIFLIIASIVSIKQMPVEVFPELNAPTVTILTEAPGYAAEEIEKTITFKIETALNGIPELRRLRSSSSIGLSIIWAEFDFGADIYRNRQQIAERLAQITESLPKNIHSPQMTPMSSIAGEIMLLALSSPDESVSPLELRKIAEFDLRPRILSIGGVAQVNALGGELPEYQILVDPVKLSQYNLTYDTVVQAASQSHAIMGGGYLPNYRGRELAVRPLTHVSTIEDLQLTVVDNTKATPILLRDIADIQIGGAPKRGTGSANGKPAVILTIQRNPNVNTLELTEKIDLLLNDFEKSLPDGVILNRNIFRQADFISLAITNLTHALRDGILFVVIILIAFLMNVRTTVITLTALPLSLGAGILLLDFFGESLNVMTLGGLAVAIGSLVDDAIIDVENFFRRAKINQSLPPESRKTILQIAYDSSVEIRPAILLATMIIVLVFAPLFFLSGIEGRFFRPLGIAYILSLLASLIVALTVTPVLCSLLFRKGIHLSSDKDSHLAIWMKNTYRCTLQKVLNKPKKIIKFSALLLVLAFLIGSTFGSSFLPEFNEGSITLFINSPMGTSLEESNRSAKQIEIQASKLSGVIAVTRRTGRAEKDEHAEPVSASELDLRLASNVDIHQVRASIVELLAQNPGITAQIGGPMEHRLSHILSGTPAAIAIKIFHDDLNELRAIAKRIESELKPLPGVRDLVANREAMVKTIPITFDRHQLALHGFTPSEVARQIETALLGTVVGVVNHEGSALDIVVRLQENARRSMEDIERLELQSSRGARVSIGMLAKLYEENSSMLITRENTQRKAVVSCNVSEGHNLGDLIQTVREKVDPIILKYPGAYVEYGGQFEAQEHASTRIFYASILVLLIIIAALYQSFQSVKMALLILLNLPLALVGGIFALFISDSPSFFGNLLALIGIGAYTSPVISISALVGFIGLSGIACRNGLLLVSHYQTLIQEGYGKEEVILRGSEERLIPILMTALSSGLALIPLVLAKGEIGSELQYPIALVILGGLTTSTFLNLYVIPAAYSLVDDSNNTISNN